MFTVGRELDGHYLIRLEKKYGRCIYVYLEIMHRARRAALQATVVLKNYIGIDVARLIGKMIYETRNDPEIWY